METTVINEPVEVFYIEAASFPDGIAAAQEKIHLVAKSDWPRKYFGISRPEPDGVIHYKAAATEVKPGELSAHGLKSFVIPKGEYLSITIKDFKTDVSSIQKAFDQLISQQNIDPQGYCIELYRGENDVQCLVKKKQ